MFKPRWPLQRHVSGASPNARTHGFVIASKDTDFRERVYVEGFPPKVIWLDVGNAGTAGIAALLRGERERRGLRDAGGNGRS
jgi:predicted nuclease of predicted toxin-antitoxin system